MAAATAALWAAGQVRGFLWSVGASLVMGLAVSGMHYTGMAALSVHLHGTAAAPTAGDSPAELLAPMMIGPLAFLLLAGVVVMFDPLMVMGKPDSDPRRAQARRARPTRRPRTRPRPPARPARSGTHGPARSARRTPQNR